MIKLLKQAFKDDPYFIFHRIRHENHTIYRNAMRAQNDYLANSRVIPITGIHPNVIFYLDQQLLQIPGVTQVLKPRQTLMEGRYSVMTTKQYFQTGTEIVKDNLHKWIDEIIKSRAIHVPSDFKSPSLAFRNGFDDDSSSGGSLQTYLLSCSSIFTVTNEGYNDPLLSTTIPVQAWASPGVGIPKTLMTNTLITTHSSITEVELNCKQEEIETLQNKVKV